MRTITLFLIKLLRAAAGLGLFIVVTFFFNHIIGFLFGISFKSVGKPTLEILGTEILAGAIIGGIYWLLDKLYSKIGSSRFDSYLKKAMQQRLEGNDFGKELLLSKIQDKSEIQRSIEEGMPWVTKLNVTKNSISGADAEIIDYGQKVILKTTHGEDIEVDVDDMQLAQIIVHLLPYHEKEILSEISS